MGISKNRNKNPEKNKAADFVPSLTHENLVGEAGTDHTTKSNTRWLMAIIIIVVIALVLLGFYFYKKQSNENGQIAKEQAKTVCDEQLIKSSGEAIKNDDRVKLFDNVDKITNLADYQKDPNCLMILIQADVKSGNTSQARQKLTLLKKVYDPENGYNIAFNTTTLTPEELGRIIDYVGKREELVQKQLDENIDNMQKLDEAADKSERAGAE